MKKRKFDEENIIHKTYKKRRLIVFFLFLFSLSFMTIGYASLNSILMVSGYLSLTGLSGDLEIISVEQNDGAMNVTSNGTNFYIKDSSTDENVVLVAEFDMRFHRAMGSSNSKISYDVVIKNKSLTSRKLTTVSSSPTFTNGNSTLNYSMDGINFLTTFIYPGDSVTVTLTFTLNQFKRNINYDVYEVFEFNFSEVTDNDFILNSSLITKELDFSTFNDIEKVTVEVQNISAHDVTYIFEVNNKNFEVVDSNGNELSDFKVSAYTTEVATFYLKVSENNIFPSLSDDVGIILVTTSPSILSYGLGDISATVPRSKVMDIIEDKNIVEDITIDFTSNVIDTGMFRNSKYNELTYFYRGNVNDNYVSFAGLIWRIIKIDRYGVKVILDDVIDTQSVWGTNPEIDAPLSDALNALNYTTSPVKTIVEDWYTSNLTNYSSAINPSLFCFDTTYQTMISSGHAGFTVYYFGSYIRNGKDSDGYTPEFLCDSEYINEYNIGLISGDEIAFAGGVFNTPITNYYLYNSSITSNWWSLSPSYYDASLGTVGMLLVNGADGSFYDWPNANTVENSFGIRPVITLDTDKLSGGSGIVGDEYTFSL